MLQGTTNFVNWVSLKTNEPSPNPSTTLPTNIFNFNDPTAKYFPYRFYRAIQTP